MIICTYFSSPNYIYYMTLSADMILALHSWSVKKFIVLFATPECLKYAKYTLCIAVPHYVLVTETCATRLITNANTAESSPVL